MLEKILVLVSLLFYFVIFLKKICWQWKEVFDTIYCNCGRSSPARMSPCQGEGSGSDSHRPLKYSLLNFQNFTLHKVLLQWKKVNRRILLCSFSPWGKIGFLFFGEFIALPDGDGFTGLANEKHGALFFIYRIREKHEDRFLLIDPAEVEEVRVLDKAEHAVGIRRRDVIRIQDSERTRRQELSGISRWLLLARAGGSGVYKGVMRGMASERAHISFE